MSPSRIAFFGATGGCVNACLAKALGDGHNAVALARSPQKLRDQLLEREIPDQVIDRQLIIIQGDVKDRSAVVKVLSFNGQGVDTVISGIGGVAAPQLSLIRPLTMTDPTVCGDATESILAAMSDLKQSSPPVLVVISANGVSNNGPRDYPLVLTPLYRWMLTAVYDDKRRMECLLEKHKPAGGFIIIRPSALINGASKGLEMVREGTTQTPVFGYSIGRNDVGLWIYANLVQRQDNARFLNDSVSLTY